MTDERDSLNRLAEQVPPPSSAFERLSDRRGRRRRNQRLMAGGVALCLAAVAAFGGFAIARNLGRNDDVRIGPGTESIPDVARVECSEAGARVLTPQVQPQRDGVHVVIANAGEPVMYSLEGQAGSFGERAELPETQVTTGELGPGAVTAKCYPETVDPATVEGATFEVIDPEGIWVAYAPDCPEPNTAVLDYGPGLTGEEGTPEDIARGHLGPQVEPGDTVERAGYPEGSPAVVRVVRDGGVVANVRMFTGIEGGWFVIDITTCD
jgi:hypothetical protein